MPQGTATELLRAMRPQQWVKNALVFVPLALTPDRVGDAAAWHAALWAFGALCAAASAGYLVNDWFDAEADRAHPTKRRRPFARGALTSSQGLTAAAALFALAAGIAVRATPPAFGLCLGVYALATLAYSTLVKRWLLSDVLLLAGLYVLRIGAGGAAVGIVPTAWLLAFSLFAFLGLAFAKRYTELGWLVESGREAADRRAYRAEDLDLVMVLGAASSLLSVLVLCLYINSEQVSAQYPRPAWLWGLVPLLFHWSGRLWFLARRRELAEDPVAFAVRDAGSLGTVAAMGVVLLVAMSGGGA